MHLSKKAAGSLFLVSSLFGIGIFAENQFSTKNYVLDQFQTNIDITNNEVSFENQEDIDKEDILESYSVIAQTPKTKEADKESNAVISTEKIADPSQRYRDVNEYLYVNKDINIYKEDNNQSEVIKKAEYADYIHKVGNDPYNNDGFSKIEIEGEEAYIETQSLTSDILFKERNQTIYAKENLSVFETLDLNNEIQKIDKIKGIKMIGESHDLVKVSIEDKTGYINKSLISKEMVFNDNQKTMWTLSDLNLRINPDVDASTAKFVYKYDEVKQVGTSEEWSKIQLSDGSYAYTKTENLTSEKPITRGEEVANYAKRFIGNPYVWGGTSLTNGTDCSGFTQSVYKHFGVNLSRTTYTQINEGRGVSYSEARPGDLIFYSGHVAIYIGNGQIVHASNSAPYPQGGIKTSPATYTTILAVRRIID